jgi:hypothetical protein
MANDYEGVLGQLGVTVHAVSREISCSCPFHPDRHPSFSMNALSGLWICYSCGRGGTMEMLIKDLGDSDADPKLVLRDVRQRRLPTKGSGKEPPPEPEVLPPDPLFIYAKFDGFRAPPEWALEARSINDAQAARFAIRWDKGWVLPIWAPNYEIEQEGLWGWQWKRMSDVLNWPDEVKKSGTLFGLRELHDTDTGQDTVAIVESPLDVVRLAMCGVAAVAAFGAYVSKIQQQLLLENADRILLALDNDKAGHEQADKIYPYLARHVPTAKVIYPDGAKDPGDCTDEQIQRTFVDLQGRTTPIPRRRRRHAAEPDRARAVLVRRGRWRS